MPSSKIGFIIVGTFFSLSLFFAIAFMGVLLINFSKTYSHDYEHVPFDNEVCFSQGCDIVCDTIPNGKLNIISQTNCNVLTLSTRNATNNNTWTTIKIDARTLETQKYGEYKVQQINIARSPQPSIEFADPVADEQVVEDCESEFQSIIWQCELENTTIGSMIIDTAGDSSKTPCLIQESVPVVINDYEGSDVNSDLSNRMIINNLRPGVIFWLISKKTREEVIVASTSFNVYFDLIDNVDCSDLIIRISNKIDNLYVFWYPNGDMTAVTVKAIPSTDVLITGLNQEETYTVCLVHLIDVDLSPYSCYGIETYKKYENRTWIANKYKSLIITLLVLLPVILIFATALATFLIIRQHPRLIKGNKRVVLVKSDTTDAVIMPKDYSTRTINPKYYDHLVRERNVENPYVSPICVRHNKPESSPTMDNVLVGRFYENALEPDISDNHDGIYTMAN